MKVSRRVFLGASASAVIVAGTKSAGKVFGANDAVNVCCIGLNGRGKNHMDEFTALTGARVVALCDVDDGVLQQRARELENRTHRRPKTFRDMREAFTDPGIDAVSIATPNHWHALAAIWACQAGKDVYVEKPLSHVIWEGRQLVAAAQKYGRVVQHGTQSRSSEDFMQDIQLLHDGIIGEVYMARGIVYKNGRRGSLGFSEVKDPPENLDWPMWQGPAPDKPYKPVYHPYNWHWFWHWGNGEIGNQGVHQMDICLWGLDRGLPVRVQSMGGRFTYEDEGETPNTQVATYTFFDGAMLVFEVRNRFTNSEGGVEINGQFHPGADVANLFYGSEGYYVQGIGFFDKKNKLIEVKRPHVETEGAFGNFLKAVRSRQPSDNASPALQGHYSSVCCHLGNIAYRLGRTLDFNPETETFVNDREANELLRRAYRPGFEVPPLAEAPDTPGMLNA